LTLGTNITTVNVGLTASTTLAQIVDTGARTLALSGTGVLTLTTANTALTSITETGAAGLNANLSGITAITAFDFSGSSGANTVTINQATQSFVGGTGADVVTITGNTVTGRAINGGTGAGVNTLVLGASGATFTSSNAANVSNFTTLGFNGSSTGAYALSTLGLATGITAISLTATLAGSVTVTQMAATTTTFNTTGNQNGGTDSFTYAGTNGASTAITLNLQGASVSAALGGGRSGYAAAGVDNGSWVIQDANAIGVGTINIVSGSTVFQALDTIVAINNTTTSALSNLNISGAGSVTIGDIQTTQSALTISDTGLGTSATSDGISTVTSTANTLGQINYSGTKAFAIATLTNNVANLTIANANTGTSGVLTIGTHTDANLASLTLTGSVALTGTYALNGAATVSGATDNSIVNLTMTGGGIKTITLGNGANIIVTGAAADVITVGTGANTITGAAGADAITVGAGHTTVDRYILNAVKGASTDSTQVVVAGNGNDTGADVYTNVNLTTDVFRVASTTMGSFTHATNTVIGTAGATADGTITSFTTSTGVIYLNGSNAAFATGDIAVTFASPSATLTAANFRGMVQYDLATANAGVNTIVTGALNDVLRSTTQTGTNLDIFTGGAGADNYVFATRANAINATVAGDTTAAVMDQITDLVVGTDTITLGTGANAFCAAVTFTGATVVNINTVTALGAATYATFADLAAAVQTARTGVASTAAIAQAYVVTTGTITTSTGFSNKTFLVINDDTSAIAATDTWIDITGVNTTTLTAGTFTFGAGGFIA
jgi:hypothetical protein